MSAQVWKRQPGGPPSLPTGTHKELREGLSSITTKGFEVEVRAMLSSINNKCSGDSEQDGEDGSPPASFAIEGVSQVCMSQTP